VLQKKELVRRLNLKDSIATFQNDSCISYLEEMTLYNKPKHVLRLALKENGSPQTAVFVFAFYLKRKLLFMPSLPKKKNYFLCPLYLKRKLLFMPSPRRVLLT
jgi:hypothetical protein